MASIRPWRREMLRTYAKSLEHKEPYELTVSGLPKPLAIHPKVFSPKYFTSSLWFAKKLRGMVGRKSLFEVGTGTGIIALSVFLGGGRVVAADINPRAVENAKENFRRHGAIVSVLKGSVYTPLREREKFDFIFWNHPFNDKPLPKTRGVPRILLNAGVDEGYAALEEYVKGAGKHLTPSGRLLLGTGSFANHPLIREIAERYGYRLKLLHRESFPVSLESRMRSHYLIYEFLPSRKT